MRAARSVCMRCLCFHLLLTLGICGPPDQQVPSDEKSFVERKVVVDSIFEELLITNGSDDFSVVLTVHPGEASSKKRFFVPVVGVVKWTPSRRRGRIRASGVVILRIDKGLQPALLPLLADGRRLTIVEQRFSNPHR